MLPQYLCSFHDCLKLCPVVCRYLPSNNKLAHLTLDINIWIPTKSCSFSIIDNNCLYGCRLKDAVVHFRNNQDPRTANTKCSDISTTLQKVYWLHSLLNFFFALHFLQFVTSFLQDFREPELKYVKLLSTAEELHYHTDQDTSLSARWSKFKSNYTCSLYIIIWLNGQGSQLNWIS